MNDYIIEIIPKSVPCQKDQYYVLAKICGLQRKGKRPSKAIIYLECFSEPRVYEWFAKVLIPALAHKGEIEIKGWF